LRGGSDFVKVINSKSPSVSRREIYIKSIDEERRESETVTKETIIPEQ
jgi:hypothetical protein